MTKGSGFGDLNIGRQCNQRLESTEAATAPFGIVLENGIDLGQVLSLTVQEMSLVINPDNVAQV
jgi:hypothetical protein